MEQTFAVCRVSVAPVRASQTDKAEITTQLLFGDQVEVLEKAEPWWKIRNAYDDYEGWIDFKQLIEITEPEFHLSRDQQTLVPLGTLNKVIAADGSIYYLAASSNLPAYKDGVCELGKEKFQVSFEPHQTTAQVSGTDLAESALFFQNAPYLWGGRTLFGIDCSGYVQTVFKLAGIRIKRDASQQAEQGITVNFLPEAQTGDLAFFDNADGKIIHVGIMLNANQIIHASGKVRIDPIDDEGIYNPELGRYSHKLRIIKRFIDPIPTR
ncbi:cell wall-associated NlpC family hydrolase [Pedobacter cryoconitis]|uniref:C40 family peptidase n=1 Tax=Pedobacter cryoconitis TaxID=188932 RepID=UPI001610C28F|nr:C40 family peptidase [Pedobacter cryoconitis]MBB6269675.1 cell wall-associated NlpC family hydrolase [Pedobacter cryoconitis]